MFRKIVAHLPLVALTPRLSCGARAQPRFRRRPPARRQLQPVVRAHLDYSLARVPRSATNKPAGVMKIETFNRSRLADRRSVPGKGAASASRTLRAVGIAATSR